MVEAVGHVRPYKGLAKWSEAKERKLQGLIGRLSMKQQKKIEVSEAIEHALDVANMRLDEELRDSKPDG